MTSREAIEYLDQVLKYADEFLHAGDYNAKTLKEIEVIKQALSALKEREERSKGCAYCNGYRTLYQQTNNTRLYIDTFGHARTLVTECDPCPPYAKCALKGVTANSAFIIDYCPNCGAKMDLEQEDT